MHGNNALREADFQVGIPNVYCGFRDDDGIVCQIQEYKTEALPKLAENRFW